MIVYRIGKTAFADDLTGQGAKINGGRWNHAGIVCLYTSESRSLALLEYTVNINIDDIPRALSFTTIEVPDSSMEIITVPQLPGNWKDIPSPPSTQSFGTELLKAAKSLIIKIPSAVMPDEWNFLINPAHPESNKCKIVGIKDFVYDVRIKLK